jgi:acetamidase/formamidase
MAQQVSVRVSAQITTGYLKSGFNFPQPLGCIVYDPRREISLYHYCYVSDIREAARDSVRHMIRFLMSEFGLDREEAYMLCSIVGDLKLHEVVDMPNYVVR